MEKDSNQSKIEEKEEYHEMLRKAGFSEEEIEAADTINEQMNEFFKNINKKS